MSEGRGDLLTVHEEVPVAADRDGTPVRERQGCGHRCRDGESHGPIARPDEAGRLVVADEPVPPDRRIAGAVGQDRLSGQAIVEDPERHAEVDPAPGCLCRFGRRLCLGVGPMGGEPGLCGRALLHPSV